MKLTEMERYNVVYEIGDGVKYTYLLSNVSLKGAEEWRDHFIRLYVGKPYPNGKGFYPFCNVRVEEVIPSIEDVDFFDSLPKTSNKGN